MASGEGPGATVEEGAAEPPWRHDPLGRAVSLFFLLLFALMAAEYVGTAATFAKEGASLPDWILLAACFLYTAALAVEYYLWSDGRQETLERADLPFELGKYLVELCGIVFLFLVASFVRELSAPDAVGRVVVSNLAALLAGLYACWLLWNVADAYHLASRARRGLGAGDGGHLKLPTLLLYGAFLAGATLVATMTRQVPMPDAAAALALLAFLAAANAAYYAYWAPFFSDALGLAPARPEGTTTPAAEAPPPMERA